MERVMRNSHRAGLLAGSALLALLAGTGQAQQVDCGLPYDVVPIGCEPATAGDAVTQPAGANTAAPGPAPTAPQGFAISINGAPLVGDRGVLDIARQADVALAEADLQVRFDGLTVTPRLDLEIGGNGRDPGLIFQSALNYPAFVTRAEVRIIDRAALGGAQTIAVLPIAPNGQVAYSGPYGDDIVAVHRVYDAQGRYDETAPLSLGGPDQRGLAPDVEDGSDSAAIRRIPVQGGAVTVSGTGLRPGATVATLGETVRPDGQGGFVIQRILPAGTYAVGVNVAGGPAITRDVEIPRAEWTYVGTIDLTYGLRRTDEGTDSYNSGRLAFFVDGRTADGWRITASADTGEGPLSDLFTQLGERDPRNLALRIDPDDLYPTYGDGSTATDLTPTSGRIFLRAETDNAHIMWGDFRAPLTGDGYVRNDRTLYGLDMGWNTRAVTATGQARAAIAVYAAEPDQLPQRDVFLGTGGTVYFLQRQDIAAATETVTIQIRDRDTGRVVDSRTLVAGTDYTINPIQGIVTLNSPLSANDGGGTFGEIDTEAVLVVQYEYVPTVGDIDGMSYGARAEGWLTDTLRVGVAGMVDQTGLADQTLVGVDLLWQMTERTFLRAEVAQSDGPGFGSSYSPDGGLIFDTTDPAGGTGQAVRVEGQVDLVDMGGATPGLIAGYYEERTEGFSSLDTQVTDTTGDETLWGLSAEIAPREGLSFTLAVDAYENAAGDVDNEARAELALAASDRLTLTFGLGYQDIVSDDETGDRTTVGLRADYALSDAATVYAFARGTVAETGLGPDDRYGIGGRTAIGANGWSLAGELSDGTAGAGGRLLAEYDDGAGGTRYIGYELDPTRDLDGVDLVGDDQGRIIAGGRQAVNERVTVFGENSYDIFGQHRTLTSAYGLTYAATDRMTYSAALEFGTVVDDAENDFERQAVTLGMEYADDALTAAARIEYRVEGGLRSGDEVNTDTLALSADMAWQIDPARQFLLRARFADTDTDENAILDGTYADVVLGYAIRPVDNDRFNLLARYRYLYDTVGQRVDGTDEPGPRQQSHVLSVDGSYDVTRNWTLGGKVGLRFAETSASEGAPWVQNDAWLAVANARYHIVHDWDALVEVRHLATVQGETGETGLLAAAYKQFNNNVSLGVGYNFGTFSDDLNDLVQDDQGVFLNLVASF